jgi:hypothetical protein
MKDKILKLIDAKLYTDDYREPVLGPLRDEIVKVFEEQEVVLTGNMKEDEAILSRAKERKELQEMLATAEATRRGEFLTFKKGVMFSPQIELRDFFAGMALMGMNSREGLGESEIGFEVFCKSRSWSAYKQADAMLKEREKE